MFARLSATKADLHYIIDMNLRVVFNSFLFAALVLVNGEQLSSATTLTSDMKVSLVIADHCSISTEGSAPAVECDGTSVYRVYDQAPFAAVPVSEEDPHSGTPSQVSASNATPHPRPKIEIAF